MNRRWVLVFLIVLASWSGAGFKTASSSSDEDFLSASLARHTLVFREDAMGGTLVMALCPAVRYTAAVTVNAEPGLPGSAAAELLAEAVVAQLDTALFFGPVGIVDGGLDLLGFPESGRIVLAGTETGLGIPPPPLFVSGWRDVETDQIRLSWENPAGGYDSIVVVGMARELETLPGDAESFVLSNAYDSLFRSTGRWATLCVVGYRNQIPSNAGTIRIFWAGFQSELVEIPFTDNLMPNWRTWVGDENVASMQLEEATSVARTRQFGSREGEPVLFNEVEHYQVVRMTNPGAQGGIYRKYLGLIPGRRYRVSARLNTWDMDDATGEWSYSFHACPGHPDGRGFTSEQFAGVEPLPDGSVGPGAACVVSYGPGETTDGEWVEVSTRDRDLPGKTIEDITLPPDVTELVVWIRHTGTDTSGVGLDWTKLEDLLVTSVSTPPFPPH